MPFVVVACTALFRQPFHKQLYATKLWKLHTQKECTLKPRASVTRISAGTLSPNFTNITSPTTSFSAVMLCFSPSLRTVASCEHFETFCFHELYILEKDCCIMSWKVHRVNGKKKVSLFPTKKGSIADHCTKKCGGLGFVSLWEFRFFPCPTLVTDKHLKQKLW